MNDDLQALYFYCFNKSKYYDDRYQYALSLGCGV